jgi:DedD protein
MARPVSDEELELKKRARRRLVGAVVLVLAVAVILPMVLDPEPKPVSQNVDIRIPSPDSGEFKPKGIPTAPKPSAAGSEAAKANAAADTRAASESPRVVARLPDAREADDARPNARGAAAPSAANENPLKAPDADAPKTAAKGVRDTGNGPGAATAADDSAASAAGAYVVQIAALADAAKAKQLQKQMARAGFPAYTEVISTAGGERTRVRAGPFATHDAAENARDRLKKAGFEGQVVRK